MPRKIRAVKTRKFRHRFRKTKSRRYGGAEGGEHVQPAALVQNINNLNSEQQTAVNDFVLAEKSKELDRKNEAIEKKNNEDTNELNDTETQIIEEIKELLKGKTPFIRKSAECAVSEAMNGKFEKLIVLLNKKQTGQQIIAQNKNTQAEIKENQVDKGLFGNIEANVGKVASSGQGWLEKIFGKKNDAAAAAGGRRRKSRRRRRQQQRKSH